MKCFKSTLAIALGAFFLAGTMVQAGEVFQTKATGLWNSGDTWAWLSGDGDNKVYPQAADETATILSGHTVNVIGTNGDAICGTLTIDNAADTFLNMQDGGVLKIEDGLTISGSGVFRFNDQGEGTPPILRATGNLEIRGNIQTTSGADEGGVIDTDTSNDSVRLVSGEISCQYGPVEIRAADFENDGTVTANGTSAGYDITFTSTCVINNASVGLWQVTHANSDMIFDHDDSTVPSLIGDSDFNVSAGRMYFMESLTTAGGYQQTGGKCEAAAAASFMASGT